MYTGAIGGTIRGIHRKRRKIRSYGNTDYDYIYKNRLSESDEEKYMEGYFQDWRQQENDDRQSHFK